MQVMCPRERYMLIVRCCFYAVPIIHILQNHSIVHLEAENVSMALRFSVKRIYLV